MKGEIVIQTPLKLKPSLSLKLKPSLQKKRTQQEAIDWKKVLPKHI
jgi:hypothetical protein